MSTQITKRILSADTNVQLVHTDLDFKGEANRHGLRHGVVSQTLGDGFMLGCPCHKCTAVPALTQAAPQHPHAVKLKSTHQTFILQGRYQMNICTVYVDI